MLSDMTAALKAMDRARRTPIVDDDFPGLIAEADRRLEAALRKANDFPTIVCLCGSTRFYKQFQEANYRETMAGKIVLSVGHYPHASEQAHCESVGCTPEQKIALDALHFRKIELADEVLILNVGGYIGESTRNELNHARQLGKTVRFLEPDQPGVIR